MIQENHWQEFCFCSPFLGNGRCVLQSSNGKVRKQHPEKEQDKVAGKCHFKNISNKDT